MFANRFPNNRPLMATSRTEFCKVSGINYQNLHLESAMVTKADHVFSQHLNFMHGLDLTTKVLTNKCFTYQKVCGQNFGNERNGFLNGPSPSQVHKDGLSGLEIKVTPSSEIIEEKKHDAMPDLYTYLVSLIKSFFSSRKGPEQATHSNDENENSPDCPVQELTDANLCYDDPSDTTKDPEKIEITENLIEESTNTQNFCDMAQQSVCSYEILDNSEQSNCLNTTTDVLKEIDKRSKMTDCGYTLPSPKPSRNQKRSKKLKKKKKKVDAQTKKSHNQSLSHKSYTSPTKKKATKRQKDCYKNKLDLYADTSEDPFSSSLDNYLSDIPESPEYKVQQSFQGTTSVPLALFLERDVAKKSRPKRNAPKQIVDTTTKLPEKDLFSSSDLSSGRSRKVSECDSEDSFIVFEVEDDRCENNSDSDYEHFDLSDGYSYEYCTEEADEEDDESPAVSGLDQKKVRFAKDDKLCRVHHLVMWSYAYQAARKGPWEEYARDRERFTVRILNVESELSKVLEPEWRRRIYSERFANSAD